MRRVYMVAACAAAATLLYACAGTDNLGLKEVRSDGIETEMQDSERRTQESRTLSHLSAIEVGVDGYVKAESKAPKRLEMLIPKFLAEIPSVELGLRQHQSTSGIEYYPASVIRDEAVDGTKLKDTGKWGYVNNERRVIIFVDCTHTSSRGKPWYRERGVF